MSAKSAAINQLATATFLYVYTYKAEKKLGAAKGVNFPVLVELLSTQLP